MARPGETAPAVAHTSGQGMNLGTDEELMIRFCDGDDAAMEVLFDRHAAGVLAFLTRMVRDPAQAEDLLQTTFLSVVRAKGRYERGTAFSPWLLTIAANAARGVLRHKKYVDAHVTAEQHSGSSVAEPPDSDPKLRERLQAALESLPPPQREAVVLHKIQGLSFEEVARATGVSAGAARIRAHRGYERLRELLQGVLG